MRIVWIGRKVFIGILLIWGFLAGLGFRALSPPFRQLSAPVGKPRVAIVIDDFGGYAAGVRAMMDLPFPLTFAVLPFGEFAQSQAQMGREKGHEIIVHFPFQALHADPRFYGKKYISTASSPEEIENLMGEAFEILPMAVGVNNHMGSLATSDPRIMRPVLAYLSKRHLLFLDSLTTTHTQAPVIASELNMAFVSRDIFLDEQCTPEHIRGQLQRLVRIARKRGSAVGIGHVGPGGPLLARILREELPRFQSEGVDLVFLSDLAGPRWVKSGNLPSKKSVVVGIDPGHGGIDSGTYWGSVAEKELNLHFSLRLAEKLRQRGYEAVLTRRDDRLLSPFAQYQEFCRSHRPYKRDDLNRRLNSMESRKASVIISIHANWSRYAYRRGPCVFYKPDSPESLRVADTIQEELNKAQPYRKIAKPGYFYLLNRAAVPAVLIETGYLSNPQDRELLKNETYRDDLIAAIIRGLERSRTQ